MKRIHWTLAALALGAALPTGQAQLPTQKPAALQQPLEATPTIAPRWQVTPQAGKYLVCAATYTGPYSLYFCGQVATYLHNKGMKTYVFNRGEERHKQEVEENERRRRLNPDMPFRPRFTKIVPEYAVMVGGWNDEAAAQKAADQIRALKPPVVRTPDGKEAYDTEILIGERENQADPTRIQQVGDEKIKLSPFLRAFATWNPTVPRQQAGATAKIDPALTSFNDDEKYSLLKNKKKYTLVVKCYEGSAQFQSSDGAKSDRADKGKNDGLLKKLGLGSKSRDVLAASGLQAHELARYLRESLKFETWVLHMRQCSLVTVGGFDSLDDPKMQAMEQDLMRLRLPHVGPAHELLPQPIPIEVPKL